MSSHLRWTVLVAAALSFVAGSGCASFMGHRPSDETAKPYPGVRIDARQIAHPSTVAGVPAPAVVVWSILDFPFSAVLDTLLLPIDLLNLTSHSPGQRNDSAGERNEAEQ